MAPYEDRYVGAKRKAQLRQAIQVEPQIPEPIQAEQGGRGIGAAATDTAAHGQALDEGDVGARYIITLLLKEAGGADDQVALVIDARQVTEQSNLPSSRLAKVSSSPWSRN